MFRAIFLKNNFKTLIIFYLYKKGDWVRINSWTVIQPKFGQDFYELPQVSTCGQLKKMQIDFSQKTEKHMESIILAKAG